MNRTPIDTGNLRAGHRSKVSQEGKHVVGSVFLLADYALFVHEAPEKTKFKSAWPRGRKYLERAIVDNVQKISGIIVGYLKK